MLNSITSASMKVAAATRSLNFPLHRQAEAMTQKVEGGTIRKQTKREMMSRWEADVEGAIGE